ncbi:tripartite motif-containing protein 16-like [Alosa sapidissima]|uniref:tripartite motif-containing protein 16-like n=1 Tax=Alosa sapidissima TaxID=34773 RepID=UPI001C0948FE|nr:tripartite motif-containing protein 16-like [Alosa sapidissima]
MGVNSESELTDTIAPPADSTGPTSDRSHLSQNASEPHSLPATSTAPAVSSSSPPAATSTAPAVSSSSPPAATSTAPAVSSSAPPAATSTAPAVSSSAPPAATSTAPAMSSSAPSAANSTTPAVSSSAPPAAGDVDMTPEDSGNTTISHQLSQKTPHVPQSKDISSITVKQSLSAEKSSNTLKPQKEDVCKQEVRPISAAVTDIKAISTESKTRELFLKCYRLFTLNPNTAHKKLYLMENNRKVEWSDQDQPYPHNPRRFVEKCFQVLCWESISERRYFEVEWSGSVCISLSFDNQHWKKRVDVMFGSNILSWALKLSRTSCCVYHNDEKIKVPQVTSSRIGVCVDYRAGTLAFYSVTDTVTLIWKVQTKFSYPLFPGFGLGQGSSVKLL